MKMLKINVLNLRHDPINKLLTFIFLNILFYMFLQIKTVHSIEM